MIPNDPGSDGWSMCTLGRAPNCPCRSASMASSMGPKSAGSGTGPWLANCFHSYFDRIHESIPDVFSLGILFAGKRASQYLLAFSLPHLIMFSTCTAVQLSRSIDFTLLICVPMERWTPEHRIHMKHPRLKLAHRGSFLRQSTQYLFSGLWRSALRIRACLSLMVLSTVRALRVAMSAGM